MAKDEHDRPHFHEHGKRVCICKCKRCVTHDAVFGERNVCKEAVGWMRR